VLCRSQRRRPDRLTVFVDLTAGLAAVTTELRAMRTDVAEVSELRGVMTAFMKELRAWWPRAAVAGLQRDEGNWCRTRTATGTAPGIGKTGGMLSPGGDCSHLRFTVLEVPGVSL
jgi:hypothetical protein